MIIAIDGPAGAGKSTVAKRIAAKLGCVYIDTGAMYRSITLKAIENSVDISDIPALAAMAGATDIDLVIGDDGALKVVLDGKDVSRQIREPRVTRVVSDIAKIKEIRDILVVLQRKLGRRKSCVMDGRDIGTVVFPDAEIKFYIDATFPERVNRRYKELKEAGVAVTPDDVAKDLSNRDHIDSTRACAPLKKAQDALYVDTTRLTIDEVVAKLFQEINTKGLGSKTEIKNG